MPVSVRTVVDSRLMASTTPVTITPPPGVSSSMRSPLLKVLVLVNGAAEELPARRNKGQAAHLLQSAAVTMTTPPVRHRLTKQARPHAVAKQL